MALFRPSRSFLASFSRRAALAPVANRVSVARIGGGGTHVTDDASFHKEEEAREKKWVNETERKLLADLVRRLETAEPKIQAKKKSDLELVLEKHNINVTAELLHDLQEWRLTH
eukprot:GABV01014870.1.p1 GENE.GABV01014870.1~~GABV01014870.1.p1  ORF type:complete len:114 (+),score=56.23 GABV01014870.1:24-365(+)